MEEIVTTKYSIVPSSSSPALTSLKAIRRGGNPFRLALDVLKRSPYVMTRRTSEENFNLFHTWGFSMELRRGDTLVLNDFNGNGELPSAWVNHMIQPRGLRLEIDPEELQVREVYIYGKNLD